MLLELLAEGGQTDDAQTHRPYQISMLWVSTVRAAGPDGFRGFKWGTVITTKEQVEKLGFDLRMGPPDGSGITGYKDDSGNVLYYQMDGNLERSYKHKEKIEKLALAKTL